MKYKRLIGFLIVWISLGGAVFAQATIVISDPPAKPAKPLMNLAESTLMERVVLPAVRKHWSANESCEEDYRVMGEETGAFSRPVMNQKLIFFQFCQTGNGLGHNGLVLIENGKVVGLYVSESGWAMDLKKLSDINRNGFDEFLLYYSGGMHQGQGGIGVDLMEFSASGAIKGLGWFQSEGFTEDDSWSYKISVKTGKTPVFYREKYISKNDRLQKSGKIAAFKLGRTYGSYALLK
jgi:hypothetical protein